MPDVEFRRAIIETRIVRIRKSQVVIERAFTEGGTQIVIRLREGVMQRELHSGVAEVVAVKRHNQGVVTRIAFIATRVDVGVLVVESRVWVCVSKIESSRSRYIQRRDRIQLFTT